MKNILKDMLVGVICGAGLVVSLWFAYPAHADIHSFLNDVHAAGFDNTNGDEATFQTGLAICNDLSGVNGEVEAERLHKLSQLSLQEAREFVIIAVTDLCPVYLPHGGTTA